MRRHCSAPRRSDVERDRLSRAAPSSVDLERGVRRGRTPPSGRGLLRVLRSTVGRTGDARLERWFAGNHIVLAKRVGLSPCLIPAAHPGACRSRASGCRRSSTMPPCCRCFDGGLRRGACRYRLEWCSSRALRCVAACAGRRVACVGGRLSCAIGEAVLHAHSIHFRPDTCTRSNWRLDWPHPALPRSRRSAPSRGLVHQPVGPMVLLADPSGCASARRASAKSATRVGSPSRIRSSVSTCFAKKQVAVVRALFVAASGEALLGATPARVRSSSDGFESAGHHTVAAGVRYRTLRSVRTTVQRHGSTPASCVGGVAVAERRLVCTRRPVSRAGRAALEYPIVSRCRPRAARRPEDADACADHRRA